MTETIEPVELDRGSEAGVASAQRQLRVGLCLERIAPVGQLRYGPTGHRRPAESLSEAPVAGRLRG